VRPSRSLDNIRDAEFSRSSFDNVTTPLRGYQQNVIGDLSAMIEEVAVTYGDQPDLWQKRIVHELVIGGLEDRSAEQRMTGDWIIFAKHEGQNFYLGLASHEEATPQIADQLFLLPLLRWTAKPLQP
jgi:hypothetical protein